ncbi:hypothetical protein ILYODFUR_021182 [Ilyodon furcidens]|uniref:Uncharacterized protein n=1 Tax=Ilyodon furcidens TaxID=33524 RepID=A0ABV0TLJ8_9TELE
MLGPSFHLLFFLLSLSPSRHPFMLSSVFLLVIPSFLPSFFPSYHSLLGHPFFPYLCSSFMNCVDLLLSFLHSSFSSSLENKVKFCNLYFKMRVKNRELCNFDS